jgi:hypothetical protein
MLKRVGQGDGGIFINGEELETDGIKGDGELGLCGTWADLVATASVFRSGGVAPIEVTETQVEDFGFDIFGGGGMDCFAQLLDQ